MKNIRFFLYLGIIVSINSFAQQNVGIGTKEPDNSAALDISSNTQGVLVPRLLQNQREDISLPAKGLLVFQTDNKSGFYYFDGEKWEPLISETQAKSVADDPNDWTTSGNSGLSSSNFIGTTDNVPFEIRTNNQRRLYVAGDGKISIGGSIGGESFQVDSDAVFNNVSIGRGKGTYGNTILGSGALANVSSGIHNVAIGPTILYYNTTGSYNVGVGAFALQGQSTGSAGDYNVAIGNSAMQNAVNAGSNIAIGRDALKNVSSSYNIGLGYQSLLNNTSGLYNIAIGLNTLKSNTTSNSQIAIGQSVMENFLSGDSNASLGQYSLNQLSSGSRNTGMGYYAGYNMTSGSDNTFLGGNSLANLVIGSNNTAVGNNSLRGSNNASYSGNTAIGSMAGEYNQGNNNVYVGQQSGQNAQGSGNLFLGYASGLNESGSNKLYISNSYGSNPLIKGEFDNKLLRINVGPTNSANQGYFAIGDFDATSPMTIAPGYRLIVQDGIITEKIKIALKESSFWADYVFEEDYKLKPLQEVEHFVKQNKHLPNVPSAAEVLENGIDIATMNSKLLEKVEELTLYIIEQEKEVKRTKKELEETNDRLERLERTLFRN